MTRILAIVCVALGLALGATAAALTLGRQVAQQHASPAEGAVAGQIAIAHDGSSEGAVLPHAERLLIPAIGVNAPIESVGLAKDRTIGVPSSKWNVAWYNGSAGIGQPGDAIVDGHVDTETGPAVLWHLDDVQTGADFVIQMSDGSRLTFRVMKKQWWAADASPAPLFTFTGRPTLTLITCGGDFDYIHQKYLQRLVMQASLVA